MKIISVFNNKGGVGKTTYMYHIAHLLEKKVKMYLLLIWIVNVIYLLIL